MVLYLVSISILKIIPHWGIERKLEMNKWLETYSEFVDKRISYIKNNNDSSAKMFEETYWQTGFLLDVDNKWIFEQIGNASFKLPDVSNNIIDDIKNIIDSKKDKFEIYILEFSKAIILLSRQEKIIPCLHTAFWNEVSQTRRALCFLSYSSINEKDAIREVINYMHQLEMIYYKIYH